MTEWRDIPGMGGSHQVSDDGQVRSRNRVLKQFPRYGGYLSVALPRPNGKSGNQFVHRLVAKAFLADGYFPGALVLHGDGNHLNNNLSNLRWGTYTDNHLDAVRHGTHWQTAKTHCPKGHPFDELNTIVTPPRGGRGAHRACRECKRARDRKRSRAGWQAKARAKAAALKGGIDA